ncbi:MAG: hypothetical protein HFH89_03625 [Lachnospiraceae bacterium]|nr:hypothetical protein [uncultured Acetatifactor sp.]MCI8286747.1 hypothetical protein [Lachnospiraceae bacterium]
MNCLILILLLGCCGGWGNNSCGCRTKNDSNCCGECTVNPPRKKCPPKEPCGRRPDTCDCREERDCCREEKPCCDKNPCDCEQNEREGCDMGLIPPPWQDYPKFPHHDNREDCES